MPPKSLTGFPVPKSSLNCRDKHVLMRLFMKTHFRQAYKTQLGMYGNQLSSVSLVFSGSVNAALQSWNFCHQQASCAKLERLMLFDARNTAKFIALLLLLHRAKCNQIGVWECHLHTDANIVMQEWLQCILTACCGCASLLNCVHVFQS